MPRTIAGQPNFRRCAEAGYDEASRTAMRRKRQTVVTIGLSFRANCAFELIAADERLLHLVTGWSASIEPSDEAVAAR